MANEPMKILTDKEVQQRVRSNVSSFRKISEANHTDGMVVVESEMRFAVNRIISDKYLRESDPETMSRAFQEVASLGLTLNPVMQYATFIPTWNKVKNCYDCVLWPMYRGLIKLATDTGIIKAVKAENVFQADKFEMWEESGVAGYKYRADIREKKNTEQNPYLGTFVVAHLANPPPPYVFEWVSAEDMFKIQGSSKSDQTKPDNPWNKWLDEMRRKGAIKRAQKYWPKSDGPASDRLARAVAMDNIIEGSYTVREEEPKRLAREKPVKLVSVEQATALITLAKKKKIAPERIAKAYFVEDLSKIPADKFDEVKERIEAAEKK